LDLLIDKENGIWHLANMGGLTWTELARLVAETFGLNKELIHSVLAKEMNYQAERPLYSILGSEKGQLLPGFENAFERYVNQYSINNRNIAMTA
jgi:dTDP-4-dehydrorhamnose reductase